MAAQNMLLEPLILWATMRDGIKLYSEVYIQESVVARIPAVMMRNPYCGSPDTTLWTALCRNLAGQGYAVINQAVRGTHHSQGVFVPFAQEQEDGYDAVEWVAAQSWCDGRVGLWGFSYLAAAALQAAVTQPPHLMGVSAFFAPSDCHDNAVYENGILNLYFIDAWCTNLMKDFQSRGGIQLDGLGIEGSVRGDQKHSSSRGEREASSHFYKDFLAHPYYDEFWASMDLERRYADIHVPVQLTGGWFDIFSIGTIRNYRGIRAVIDPRAQGDVHLRMVPTCHGPWLSEDWKFAYSLLTDPETLTMSSSWWRHIFLDQNSAGGPPPVELYVMAPPIHGNLDTGFWITSDHYPLPNTKERKLFITSGGNANSVFGDGVLCWNVVPTSPSDTFIHDVTAPVPTCGGSILPDPRKVPEAGDIPGPRDQAENEARKDVLVYSSKLLSSSMWIIGPVSIEFWAQTSGADTNFTAKLVIVQPDGVALNVLDRVVNSHLRKSSRLAPESPEPGNPAQYFLHLGDTAIQLEAGMSLRLEIASSNYPRFALNPSVHARETEGRQLFSATQTIFHDATHPSWISLPLVDGTSLRKAHLVD